MLLQRFSTMLGSSFTAVEMIATAASWHVRDLSLPTKGFISDDMVLHQHCLAPNAAIPLAATNTKQYYAWRQSYNGLAMHMRLGFCL